MIYTCGLFGAITNVKVNQKLSEEQIALKRRAIKALAVAMEDRGDDSTGIAGILDNSLTLKKKAIEANKFVNTNDFNKVMSLNPNIVIGHTRLACVGAVTDDNAHPFLKGSIVGAHNGVVSNHLEINNKVEVDSEVIFQLLNDNKNKFEETFKRLSGSFALTWSNLEQPNEVFLVTHNNPLAVVCVPEIKTYFWASEKIALRSIMTALFSSAKEVWEPNENCVYQINGELKINKYKIEFKSGGYTYYSGYDYDNRGYDWEDRRVHANGEEKGKFKKVDYRVIDDFDETGEDTQIKTMVWMVEAEGCGLCFKDIDIFNGFYYSPDDGCICPKCMKENRVGGDFEFIEYEEYVATRNSVDIDWEIPKTKFVKDEKSQLYLPKVIEKIDKVVKEKFYFGD